MRAKLPKNFQFEKEMQKAINLKSYSCLLDLYESHNRKEMYYYASIKDDIYFELLSIIGLAEGNHNSYKITKKGIEYIKLER